MSTDGIRDRPGGFGRAAPRSMALAALAISALILGGCASDPCGGGGLGGRLGGCNMFKGGGLGGGRLFHRNNKVVEACEPGMVGEACAPIVGPGAVIPGPGAVVAPGSEEIDLSPAPGPASGTGTGAAPASPGTTQGAARGAGHARYIAPLRQPRAGSSLARRSPASPTTLPEPANGPAAGAPVVSAPKVVDDPLVNLPPLETPIDRREPVPPEAEKVAKAPAEAPSKPAEEAKVSIPVPGAATPAELPPRAVEPSLVAAPGIKHFKAVEPQLAGGSTPTAAGWGWLSDLSYKTVLDLRDPKEDRQDIVALLANQPFRYVALPVSAESLDSDLVKRFLDELSMSAGRPLYFFDTEGTRAATLWYIKLVSVDKADPTSARKAAEELGPIDSKFAQAAAKYLDRLRPSTAEAAPAPAAAPTANVAPAPAPETKQPEPAAQAPTTSPVAEAAAQAPTPAAEVATQTPNTAPQDETAWRSYAALIMSGLSVPLAYLGRSALHLGQHSRPSLPAPARQPQSLPLASGDET